jgi:phage host-nuclease inhibitor protein Gam
MAANRTKKVVLTGVTGEKMNQAFADFARADAESVAINARMDEQFTEIREANADRLAELQKTKDGAFEIMQAYAVENRDTLFAKKKSMETAHGVLGFRIGNPKPKTLKGFTWAAVLMLAKALMPEYVRTTEELAKDKLLADRNKKAVADLFPKIGIEVIQDETFFVEPKKEAVDG